jgi:uncharacterized protein
MNAQPTTTTTTSTSTSTSPARRIAKAALAVGIACAATFSLAGTASAAEVPVGDAPLVSSAAPPHTVYSGDELTATATFAAGIIQLADTDWTNWFVDNDLDVPRVGYQMIEPGDSYQSNCTLNGQPMVVTGETENAFYCSTDTVAEGYQGTIVVPVPALRRIWDGDLYSREITDAGDFTAATVIAHEFGHHVADELVTQGVFAQAPTTEKNRELIADCFAGNWVASAYGHGYMDDDPQGHIAQSVEAMEMLGDYEVTSPLHHGTPQERANAINIGIYGSQANPAPASPQNCIAAYWS